MNLLSPLALLGLLGLVLPIIAHLLGRERPLRIEFAAMRFVTPREPVITQRRAIRDWPLLLLRLVLLALLVIVLARPVVGSEAEVTVIAEPHDAVVLLDASASMHLIVDDISDHQRARQRLDTLLDAMPPGSRIGLVVSDPKGPELGLAELGESIPRIRARIDEWEPRPGGWSMAEALPRALALLEQREGDRPRVVYAIGDPTGTGLGSLPRVGADSVTIVPIPTRGRAGEDPQAVPEHVGLHRANWAPAPELDPRAMRIEAVAHRYGGDEHVLEVGIGLVVGDQEVARTKVALSANGEAPIEFVHTPTTASTEALRARIQVLDRPSDPLNIDDRRHLWLTARDEVEVLIVNGDPSDTRANDEIFFFATALASTKGELAVRGLAPDQLEQRIAAGDDELADVDLLVLANVRAPSLPVATRISSRVESGMGLWVTVGDRVSATEYNERLGPLLPLLLREAVYTGTAPGRTEARSEALAPVDLGHPIFAGVDSNQGDLDLGTTRTKRMFLLDPDPRRDAEVALAFTSGAPALITRAHVGGRVALLTTTIDRDWSDLPLRPGFVPLVVRTAQWLTGASVRGDGSALTVGAPQILRQAVPHAVHTPGGEVVPVAPEQEGSPARFIDTDRPGHYRALANGEDDAAELFIVEVDHRESDTATVAVGAASIDDQSGTVTIYTPRWRELALLVLVLLAIESSARWWVGRSR